MSDSDIVTAQGTATDVQLTQWETTHRKQRTTHYRALFFLGEQEILVEEENKPLRIADGDQIVVAGSVGTFSFNPHLLDGRDLLRLGSSAFAQQSSDPHLTRNILHALVYHNLTSDVYGGHWRIPDAGIILIVIALLPFCLLIFPIPILIMVIRGIRKTRRAWEMLAHVTGRTYH